MFPRNKWKILRGDTVVITKGKDAGQTGVISKVHRDSKKPGVTVKGMNLVRKCNAVTAAQTATNVAKHMICNGSHAVCAEQKAYQAHNR